MTSMTRNVESRGARGRTRLSGNVVLQADNRDMSQSLTVFQMPRLLSRLDFSPERARAVAELAFATPGGRA